jgi:hypothetical protein
MAKDFDFSGIWHSTYHFTSTAKPGNFTSEYDVKMLKTGNQLVVQSLPNEGGSYILLRLTVDGRILTGTWHEQTEPEGDFKGATYYGALQLIVAEDGQAITGQYVVCNRKFQIQSGIWEMVRNAE